MLLLLAVLLGGCTATIAPPDSRPDNGRDVFVLDHGYHTSLVLSRGDETLVRYVYGEWRWYARSETGFLRLFPTLLSRTPATLGRKQIPGPPTEEAVLRQVGVVTTDLYHLRTDSDRTEALIDDLDALFEARRDTLHYNPVHDLEFVRHPVPYSVRHTSNHMIANWLEELGIEVHGNPVMGRWRMDGRSQ